MSDDYARLAREEWDRRAKVGPEKYTAGSAEGVAKDFDQIGRTKIDAMMKCLEGKPTAAWDVLEVGPGIGQLMEAVAPKFKTLTGVDISPEMIRQCEERLKKFPNVKLMTVPGDGEIPGADASYDMIFCISVFHHVPKSVFFSYVKKLRRLIKPGGHLFFQLTLPYSFGRKVRAFFQMHPPDSEAWKSRYYTEGAVKRLAADTGYEWGPVVRDERNWFFMWRKPTGG